MKWIKKGLIFCPDKNYDWMWSHAANPTVEPLGNSFFRVYFSCRDKDNRSSVGFIEFDINHPNQISYIHDKPVVSPGEPGTFDDSGASIGCILALNGKRYLYYTGWNLGVTVPWRNSIGLAISDGEEPVFYKYSIAPIIDRSEVDPYSISYPWVIFDGSVWKMWYGSNLAWGKNHNEMKHVIKYAESKNGIHWDRKNIIAVPLEYEGEWGISKPCVRERFGKMQMWYSYRGENYRIGYAESANGIHWTRMDDEVGISVSQSGWDSEMIEYPCVFDHEDQRYLIYNGNRFGKTGFGLAVLEQN